MTWTVLPTMNPIYRAVGTSNDSPITTDADSGQPGHDNGAKTCKAMALLVLVICVAALGTAGVLLWSAGALKTDYDAIQLQQNSSSSSSFLAGHLVVPATESHYGQANANGALASDPGVMQYFTQAGRCGHQSWMDAYSQLHRDITTGKLPPKYLVSVAVEKGLADRLTGLVTEFYIALLSQRALTTVTYGSLPSFKAVCDMPNINLTYPYQISEDLLGPLRKPPQPVDAIQRPWQTTVSNSKYYGLYTVDDPDITPFVINQNFSGFPEEHPAVPNVLWASNRGGTYDLMHNSFHRAQLWGYGLTPETAFMCGFFYICKPNNAVQALYQHFWQPMSEPGTLKIGIQVRFGDRMFRGGFKGGAKGLLTQAKNHFDCAKKVEKAYAVPGQKVVWYLISDSLALCQAAKLKYGDKVITETDTKPMHVDCAHNPEACSPDVINLAMQHALGQVLTFSKADYHVITRQSGFGRLGAWMSGKYDNIYEIGSRTCDPQQPLAPSKSASHWSRV